MVRKCHYLLQKLSQEKNGQTDSHFHHHFVIILGAISGPLKSVCSIRHKHINPLPIYRLCFTLFTKHKASSCSRSATFLNLLHPLAWPVPPPICTPIPSPPASPPSPPVAVDTRNVAWKNICQRQPSSLSVWSNTRRFSKLRVEIEARHVLWEEPILLLTAESG